MPGFAVSVVETGFTVAFLAEEEAGAVGDFLDGEDVPPVFGDDVGGEEVDFGGGVGDGASVDAAAGVDVVETVDDLGGSFDLHAPKAGGRKVRGRNALRCR